MQRSIKKALKVFFNLQLLLFMSLFIPKLHQVVQYKPMKN